MVKTAIILAGGKGERLRPLTENCPKPMVEVNSKPIILYQIEQLLKAGISRIIFTCSYKKEVLMDCFKDGSEFGFEAIYSIEETPLGRGGAIKQGMKMIEEDWEDVIVTNGDNLWRFDVSEIIKLHEDRKALVTMYGAPLKSPYGIIDFNDNLEITGFREKPQLPYWLNAGVYLINKEVMEMLPDVGDHETETFPKLPQERFIIFKHEGYWRGVDTVKDKTEAEKEVLEVFVD